jgi:hypothetical protein
MYLTALLRLLLPRPRVVGKSGWSFGCIAAGGLAVQRSELHVRTLDG